MARKKAQAAIEFMTTYGWALMAILVAIGALSYFDFLNADRYKSVGCSTGTQIQCLEAELTSSGVLRINLRNNYPVGIDINSALLRTEGSDFVLITKQSTVGIPGPDIDRGQTQVIAFNAQNFQFTEGSKQTLDININFSRDSSVTYYNTLGTLTVRIAP